VKEQYVGDINDYRKYALLRRLQAGSGLRTGVCWMLTPSDGRSDGSMTNYLNKPGYERHDPELYGMLRDVMAQPDRRHLQLIEDNGIIAGATYHNAIVPDPLAARVAWFDQAIAKLSLTDLIFFDPDNGIDVPSKPKGSRDSSKYLYRDELAATYAAGHSVLLYQHFPHQEHVAFLDRISADLRTAASGAEVWVFRTPHVAFFLLIHPRHYVALHAASQTVSSFNAKFISMIIPPI
jgi:hypothetical protein